MGSNDLLVVAGEASGDLHGARLLGELRRLHPEVRAYGLGGDELSAHGLEALAHSSEISVVGLTEAVRVLPRARRIFRQLLAETERRKPAAALLIDSPDFNLRLARSLGRLGVRVVYYVSPQVWAWRRGRVKAIAQHVDRMLVLFPFEVGVYEGHDLEVVHVGHPLVDEVPDLPQVWDGEGSSGAFQVALLPGSRRREVERLLPILLGAARRLSADLAPERPVRFVLVRAATIPAAALKAGLSGVDLDLEVVDRDRFSALAASHLALCASGTAALEVGLLGTPLIVVYRVGFWTGVLGRLLIESRHISLVNLVLQREAVPELVQGAARADTIAAAATALLRNPDKIRTMRGDLGLLRGRLGEPGASRRAAEQVWQVVAGAPAMAGETTS